MHCRSTRPYFPDPPNLPNLLSDQVASTARAPAAIAVQVALADLRRNDGAQILAARLYQDGAGLDALLELHGEIAIRAIKSILTRAMIDGAKVASVRSWRYPLRPRLASWAERPRRDTNPSLRPSRRRALIKRSTHTDLQHQSSSAICR